MNRIQTTDLIYLNEASKVLKQKDLIVAYNPYSKAYDLVGLDNMLNCFCCTRLDGCFEYGSQSFNAKSLSDFIKTMVAESSFDIIFTKEDLDLGISRIVNTYGSTFTFQSSSLENCASKMLDNFSRLDCRFSNTIEINDVADELRSMHVADGALYRFIENHYVTLFPGIFPLVKADRLSVQFYDDNISTNGTFIAKYIIKKKKFTILCYICYLYI